MYLQILVRSKNILNNILTALTHTLGVIIDRGVYSWDRLPPTIPINININTSSRDELHLSYIGEMEEYDVEEYAVDLTHRNSSLPPIILSPRIISSRPPIIISSPTLPSTIQSAMPSAIHHPIINTESNTIRMFMVSYTTSPTTPQTGNWDYSRIYGLPDSGYSANQESSLTEGSPSREWYTYPLINETDATIQALVAEFLDDHPEENHFNKPTPEQVEQYTECISLSDVSDDDKYNTCPISLEPFADNAEIIRIRHCNHYFSKESILNWFNTSHNCPLCRHNIFVTRNRDSDPDTPPDMLEQEHPQ